MLEKTREAYQSFRSVPAPKRGEILRQIREALSKRVSCTQRLASSNANSVFKRDDLGALVSLEMGKIRTEGEGEVQEFIDIVSLHMKLYPIGAGMTVFLV